MILGRYSGTEPGLRSDYDPWTTTETHYFRSCGFNAYIAEEPKYSTRMLLIMINAEKATERMLLLGKMFCQTKKTLSIPRTTFVRKSCFSASGHLKKRIRRIRKDK